MSKPIAVLAGNRNQFVQYQHEHPDQNLFYCCDRVSMMGREFSDFVVIGTFFDKEDATNIYELVRTRVR